MEPDFGGYVTKAGIKCSDGLTIMPGAFKHQDKTTVPLVDNHNNRTIGGVLGHVELEHRGDGVYGYAYLNDTKLAQSAKILVHHKDIEAFSIWANQLNKKGDFVHDGSIKEVSLCLAGANPGAKIDFISIAHSDGTVEEFDDEAVIYPGTPLVLEHAENDGSDKTVKDVYDSMSEEQKNVLHYMVGAALEAADENDEVKQSDETEAEETLEHQEGGDMTHNVFESQEKAPKNSLSHSQIQTIFADAQKLGSLKEAFLAHDDDPEYGITNIDVLFPEPKNVQNTPEWITRRMEWVSGVINGAHKSPFSRIKSRSADITHYEARAKGYIKANLKKEQFFAIAHRSTTPKTVYKKQKLDRDDIIDITDFDVVAWIKAEMRVMMDEEVARAILIGDGRDVEDPDKIDETNIRPIATDEEFYTHRVIVPANTQPNTLIETILRTRKHYKGKGNPVMFCVEDLLTDMLLTKDKIGRRYYNTVNELENALRVSKIVTVPVMEDVTLEEGHHLLAVLVNMSDYTVGADRGGQMAFFDDFDIDYNQYKYLYESRFSGALTRHKTAMAYWRAAGILVPVVTAPTFVTSTGVLTVPATTGIEYYVDDETEPRTAGAQTAIAPEATIVVSAVPDEGYYFPLGSTVSWEFTRDED